MSRLKNGESAEQVEDLAQTDVRGRQDLDPEAQRNREDSPSAGEGEAPMSPARDMDA